MILIISGPLAGFTAVGLCGVSHAEHGGRLVRGGGPAIVAVLGTSGHRPDMPGTPERCTEPNDLSVVAALRSRHDRIPDLVVGRCLRRAGSRHERACHADMVQITRPVVAGAIAALVGQVLVVGVTVAVAVAAGGGPTTDLEPGGKMAVLLVAAIAYGVAQLVVVGGCVVLSGRLGRGSSVGMVAGSVIGLAGSLYYLCGGQGA
jgi:hypothetical protein